MNHNDSHKISYEDRLSDFVEAAAHDLHAPLRKLSTMVERVFTQNAVHFDESSTQYVGRILSCIEEMKSLIDGLTELAKAAPGPIDTVNCDLNVVVNEVLGSLSEEIAEKHARVMVSTLPTVTGNGVQYRQLFKNLLENAIKFSRRDVVSQISIAEEPIDGDEVKSNELSSRQKYYKIVVRDNGIGFDQAYAEKIFEPFVRLHPKSQYDGNGLGLSICRKIVDNHNGIIYARGTGNEGSLFVLILPQPPLP